MPALSNKIIYSKNAKKVLVLLFLLLNSLMLLCVFVSKFKGSFIFNNEIFYAFLSLSVAFIFILTFTIYILQRITRGSKFYDTSEKEYDFNVVKKRIEKIIKDKEMEIAYGQDQQKIIKNLGSFIYKRAKEEASENILSDLKESLKIKMLIDSCESVFMKTIDRLYSEISSLTGRGNANLGLGMTIGVAGLGGLLYFVLSNNYNDSTSANFICHFIPRLSLIMLVETFAYFFLKLYKTSLDEIKYYQNELTNIEQKFAAAIFSMDLKNPCTTKEVIAEILKTERNFILKKGQTTVEIEKEKMGDKNILSALNVMSKIIKKD